MIEEEKTYITDTNGQVDESLPESSSASQSGNLDFRDNIEQYQWDGAEDSDEEVAEFANLKQTWEKDANVKFSKKGLMRYINKMLATETAGQDNANSKLWEQKLKIPGITYYLKNGGSKVNKTQPFFRVEA